MYKPDLSDEHVLFFMLSIMCDESIDLDKKVGYGLFISGVTCQTLRGAEKDLNNKW